MVKKVDVQVRMDYIQSPDSQFAAQLVDDFLFPWEEAGSAEKLTAIDEDEGFSETMRHKTQSYHSDGVSARSSLY